MCVYSHWALFTNWIFSAMVCFHFGPYSVPLVHFCRTHSVLLNVYSYTHIDSTYTPVVWKSCQINERLPLGSSTHTHIQTQFIHVHQTELHQTKPHTEIASRVNSIVSVPVYFQRTRLYFTLSHFCRALVVFLSLSFIQLHALSLSLSMSYECSPLCLCLEWIAKWKMKSELKRKIRSTKCF